MDGFDSIPFLAPSTGKLKREVIYKGMSKVKVPPKEIPYPRVETDGELFLPGLVGTRDRVVTGAQRRGLSERAAG